MFKETIICIVIIVSIFTLDNITQSYTEEKSTLLKENLNNLRSSILDENSKEELLNKMDDIDTTWEDMHEKMSYFIEHDELEKVETDLTTLRSYIEMEDKTMAISMIDESCFIIEHIIDKNNFSLENIF